MELGAGVVSLLAQFDKIFHVQRGHVGKELEAHASKKAMEVIEDFIKKQGKDLIPAGSVVFDQFRPILEGSYSHGYQDGYTDALKRVMEDRP